MSFKKDKNLTNKRYISLLEAARIYGCTQKHFALMARQGKLKAIKIGRDWMTTFQWLEEYTNYIDLANGNGGKIPEISQFAKKIFVLSLVSVMLFAFFASAYTSFKDGVLQIPKPIEDFIVKISSNNTQDINKLPAQAIIETNRILATSFNLEDIFQNIKHSKIGNSVIDTVKTMVLGIKAVDRKSNAFFNPAFRSVLAFFDKILFDSGNFVINLFRNTIKSIGRIPLAVKDTFSRFVSFFSFKSFTPFYYSYDNSDQLFVSIRELYQKLRDMRELIEGKTIVINKETQQIIQYITKTTPIQKEVAVIKDQDLLNAQLAVFKDEVLAQIVSDVTDFQSRIGSQIITQNNYYYSEAAKAGGFDTVNNEVDFNESVDMMKNLTVVGTIIGGILSDGTLTIGSGNISGGDTFSFTHASISDDLTINNINISDSLIVESFAGTHVSVSDDLTALNGEIDNLIFTTVSGLNAEITSAGFDNLWSTTITDNVLSINSGNITGGQNFSFVGASISDDLTIGDNITFSDSMASISGDFSFGDGLLVSNVLDGGVSVSGNFEVTGNVELGDATADVLIINSYVGSNLIPNANNFSLGTSDNRWRYGYIDELTVATISATGADIGGTINSAFIINSDNGTNDTEDSFLTFERGSLTNASLKWDSTNDRFDFNFPLSITGGASISDDLTIGDNITFSDSLASISSTLTLDGILDVNGTASSTFAGDLDIEGDVNIGNNDLYVDASSGNVGIGTTAPASKLHIGVAPTASANYGTLSIGSGAFDGSTAGKFVGSASGTSIAVNEVTGYAGNLIDLQVNGASKFSVDNTGLGYFAGNVGIGIAPSSTNLYVKGGTQGNLVFQSNSATLRILAYTDGTTYLQTGTSLAASSADLIFTGIYGDGGTKMIIKAGGNVGIGTTGPDYTLSVDGTASISDDFYVGNDMLFADVSDNTIYSSASWDISGNLEFDNLAMTHASISDDLSVVNNIHISSGILDIDSIASSTFAGDLDIEGDVNIGGNDLYVDASSGRVSIGGDLTITGDDLFMTTNTSGAVLVADGTNFNPVVMSGDASIGIDGVVIVADDSHNHVITNIDSFTSAELAEQLSNETGTGLAVFATSPQFTTSFTTAGVFAISPGGALTIGDNGDTLYLNSSDWDIDATGVMTGIGDITTNGGYTQSGTTANTFTGTATFSNATYSALFTGGNVGIGTTSPNAKLDVVDSLSISTSTNSRQLNFNILQGSFISNETSSIYTSMDGGTYPFTEYGNLIIQPRTSTGNPRDIVFATGNTTPSARMIINRLGNVGIGTTAPGATLDLKASAGGDALLRFSHSTAPTAAGIIMGLSSDETKFEIKREYSDVIYDVMAIDRSTGNVGIGTTAPGAKLEVIGSSGITSFTGTTRLGASIGGAISTDDYSGLDFLDTVSSGTLPKARIAMNLVSGSGSYLNFGTSNVYANGITNTAMTINHLGNVGIGTTGPDVKLHVEGSETNTVLGSNATSAIRITNTYGGTFNTGGELQFEGPNGAGTDILGVIRTAYNAYSANGLGGDMFFGTKAADANPVQTRMTILSTGNVGIGTTAPGATLDIRGGNPALRVYDSSANLVLELDESASPIYWEQGLSSQFEQGTFYQTTTDKKNDYILLDKLSGENYYSTGTYTTIIRDTRGVSEIDNVRFIGIIPESTKITAHLEVSDNNFATVKDSISFELQGGGGLEEFDPGSLASARYIRVRFDFETNDSSVSPRLAFIDVWYYVSEPAQNLSDLNADGTAGTKVEISNPILPSFSLDDLVNELKQLGIAIKRGIVKIAQLVVKTLVVEKNSDQTQSSIGEGVIATDSVFAEIRSNQIMPTSKIFITFRGDYGSRWWINYQEKGLAIINVADPVVDDVKFDWWIVQTEPVDTTNTQDTATSTSPDESSTASSSIPVEETIASSSDTASETPSTPTDLPAEISAEPTTPAAEPASEPTTTTTESISIPESTLY